MFKKAIIATIISAASASSVWASGGGVGTLNVTLNVASGCDINGGSGIGKGSGQNVLLAFGDQAQGATGVTASTTNSVATGGLIVTCSGTQTPSVSFDAGKYPSGTQRNMMSNNGAATVLTIPYTLGSTSAGTDLTPNTAYSMGASTAGTARALTIYGAITGAVPSGAEGQYSDTVQISLSF